VLVALLLFFPNMSFKFWERLHGGDGALVARRGATVRGRQKGCDCQRSPEGLRLSEVARRAATVRGRKKGCDYPRSPEGLRLPKVA
jgi:hypothetical protein